MIIRNATMTDAELLADFASRIASETESLRLTRDVVLDGVRALISNPDRGWYLVAEIDRQVVGMLLVTTEWSDWHNGDYWWIQSVYVREDHRRQGIYRRLYEHVRRLAEGNGAVRSLRLYVERENDRAQGTYSSLGMAETPYRIFEEVVTKTPSVTRPQPSPPATE